jgi:hypothetical protein
VADAGAEQRRGAEALFEILSLPARQPSPFSGVRAG